MAYKGNYSANLFRFKMSTNTWESMPENENISGRTLMGFASAPDKKLYVFGGYNPTEMGGREYLPVIVKQ